jgi:CheY-like chemotaxis protein
MMPEMDGFEFAAELHKHAEWRTIPVVVLTGKDLSAEELRELNGNVNNVIDKGDSTREELMRQVGDLIAGLTLSSRRANAVELGEQYRAPKVKVNV